MRSVEKDLDRILSHLRKAIHASRYTQLEVQEACGWGRSYISQLVNKQKGLRIEQILLILNVIDVKPEDFFGELFPFGPTTGRRGKAKRAATPTLMGDLDTTDSAANLRRLRLLFEGIVSVLMEKHLITATDLERAIEAAKRKARAN